MCALVSVHHVFLAVWLTYEQTAIAALDCHNLHAAATLIKAVLREFPDSARAKRLRVRGKKQLPAGGSFERVVLPVPRSRVDQVLTMPVASAAVSVVRAGVLLLRFVSAQQSDRPRQECLRVARMHVTGHVL
jgi:hypothetical protein